MSDEARAVLDAFAGKRVLVVGDLMVDEYIWGAVDRISPEAPVIVVNVQTSESRPGGAANVACNLRALGAQVSVVGLVGDDEGGRTLVSLLESRQIDTSGVVVDSSRPTTKKTRVIAHSQQVVRVDHESRDAVSSGVRSDLARAVHGRLGEVDAVLVSDYDKGVTSAEVVSRCSSLADRPGIPVTANPKPPNLRNYRGCTLVTLNQIEAQNASGERIASMDQVALIGRRLAVENEVGAVVVTCGPRGLVVCPAEGEHVHLPAVPVEVYDVAGAGDTVISVLTLALASGADIVCAAALANCAGGAAVRKVGVATVSAEDILGILDRADAHEGGAP